MEVVKTLISKGCNVNITSKDSWSPLHYAWQILNIYYLITKKK